MLKSYFKIALRNLLRHKGYTLVNVSGLTIGLVVCLFILLYVRDEISFDAFHENEDRLYRILEDQHYADGTVFTTSATPGPLAKDLVEKIPEITKAARVSWGETKLFQVGEKSFKENGKYVDTELFQIFTFPLIEGNAQAALNEPNSLIISETLAKKYFGQESALGKQIRVDTKTDYLVTGVMKDIPRNSSLVFDFAMRFEDLVTSNTWLREWGNNAPRTYILVGEGSTQSMIESKIEELIKSHEPKSVTTLFLQPFTEMYLHSDFSNGKRGEGRIQYVWLFTIVAGFILIIACVNFMNLATAQSARRAKEVGVRKAIGAPRLSLIGQFLGESMLMAFLAAAVAVGLVELMLPTFNQITEKNISLQFSDPLLWGGLTFLVVLTGVIAGSYPAFFLSSFDTISVLKGTFRLHSSTVSLRKGLVVFQFFVATVLILSTIMVYRQIQFILNKNLGMDRENVICVNFEGDMIKNYEPIKRQLIASSSIASVTAGSQNPLAIGNSTSSVSWPGIEDEEKILFQILSVQYDFFKTMGAAMNEGREFSPEFPSDTSGFVLNEEAVRRMNLSNPIGRVIKSQGTEGPVIGVVGDFHNVTMHLGIEPLVVRYDYNFDYGTLFVKTVNGQTREAIDVIEKTLRQYNPAYPLDYKFLDENFERMYKSEKVTGVLSNFFAGVAVLISCLGLLGLASFNAEQRSKEIGIRKVMGASVSAIVLLLSKDFIQLVLVGNIIAAPVAYFALQSWLEDFAYRVNMGAEVFVAAVIISVFIAILTVSYRAIKAATANPVEALKYE